jgi:undecaprenyl-phosphate 4-deoxy-4-formamido-L-arabinose transferase
MPGSVDDLTPPAPYVSIVVPVYRSEQCLPALIDAIESTLSPLGWSFEVVLVNDFSPDGSWQTIESLCIKHPFVIGVDLRRNFGQDNAILTGMRLSHGQFVVVLDDDLQHDPKYIPRMIEKAEEGLDVVFVDFATKHQHLWKNMGIWVNGKIAEWLLYKPKGIYLPPRTRPSGGMS